MYQRAIEKIKSFLRNLKIAKKLLLGFLSIALFSAAMGIYASANIVKVSASAGYMYEKILLPVRNVSMLSDMFKEDCINLRQALLADERYAGAHLSTLKTSSIGYTSILSMLEPLISENSRESFNALKSAYNEYGVLLNEAISEIEAGNKDQVLDDIMHFGKLESAESNVADTIDELKFVVTDGATAEATDIKDISQSVVTVTVIIVSVVLVLSILIGIFTAKGISRPINRLTEKVKKLAAGDTNITLSETASKDEVGQMRRAIGTIINSIKELENDTDKLIGSAMEGQLSMRADVEKHRGAYRKIVEGINSMLDAMIAPINESTGVLAELSQGNLSVSVEGDFAGEFAIIKNALNGTIHALKSYIDEIGQVLGDVANGILTINIGSDFKGDFATLKESINSSIRAFNGVLKGISLAAEEVSEGAALLSGGSQVISQGATEQAGALGELTESISGIADKTRINAKSASESNVLSLAAMEDALSGNEKMQLLQKAMKDIDKSSESISKIIKVIDDIAFQTNILALNAAVEAARAGMHGKGFAVVAEEVRNLAAMSAKAAQETAILIESSIEKTAAGTRIADETASALRSIVEGIQKIVALSGEIAGASNEQATGIAQVDKGIEQLSSVVQHSSATAQEAATSSEELAAQAEYLKQMVGKFELREDQKIAKNTPSDVTISKKPEIDTRAYGAENDPNNDNFGSY